MARLLASRAAMSMARLGAAQQQAALRPASCSFAGRALQAPVRQVNPHLQPAECTAQCAVLQLSPDHH